tara:strand:- start:3478 stop:4923 length:1446 start_codon:yes stop_codon:yes gene_type:complete
MKLPKLQQVSNGTKKKKILLMSDDCRLKSGVGTVSKNLIVHMCDKYNWAQIGGAIKHPDEGKVIDMSDDLNKITGRTDNYCKIYPTAGYGNPDLLRRVMSIEKPDAIIHFTDPRFWEWLYDMEHEVRQNIPIMYYNIWDDLPFPHWNENAYESCDLIMSISKQTYNINKHVCTRKPRVEGIDLQYVPHGIDENYFFPIDKTDAGYIQFKEQVLPDADKFEFIPFFNSRNIRRKSPSDLILAFRKFCEMLKPEEAAKCALFMHTDPVDNNGTDLPAVKDALCRNHNVIFSKDKVDEKTLNYIYNLVDVTCNPSSAEGFGLSHMESLMAGTPTITSVIGGLQDQMGFKVNGEELSVKHFTSEIPSNSTGEISTEHGEWTLPLWPQLNLQGSPATPYIYDSRVSISQIANQLKVWYDMGKEERERRGKAGRDWAIENKFTAKGMANFMKDAIETCFENWKPRERFTLINVNDHVEPKKSDGVLI